MSPKKTPVIKRTTVLLPEPVHNRCRQIAAGTAQSLSTWLASLAARESGMTKQYKAPHWGRKKNPG